MTTFSSNWGVWLFLIGIFMMAPMLVVIDIIYGKPTWRSKRKSEADADATKTDD